jgi:hypothetical protein
MIKSRMMRWVKHVAPIELMRNVYKILVGKHEGKKPFKRPRYVWEDNIKIGLKKIVFEGVDWFYLAQSRDQ